MKIRKAQKYLLEMGIDGWLLYDFARSNELVYQFLELPSNRIYRRRFFYWIPARGTPVEGSRLVVEVAPVVLHCPACDRDVEPPDVCRLACPVCGTATADVRGGREFEVESIEVV